MKLKVLALVFVLVLVLSACSGEQNNIEIDKSSIDTTIGDFESGSSNTGSSNSDNPQDPQDNADNYLDIHSNYNKPENNEDNETVKFQEYYEDLYGIEIDDPLGRGYVFDMGDSSVDIESVMDYEKIEIPTKIGGEVYYTAGYYDETRVLMKQSDSGFLDESFTKLVLYDFVSGEYKVLIDVKDESRTMNLLYHSSDYIVFSDGYNKRHNSDSNNNKQSEYLSVYDISSGEIINIHEYQKALSVEFPSYSQDFVIDGDLLYYSVIYYPDNSLHSFSSIEQRRASYPEGEDRYTTFLYDLKNRKQLDNISNRHSPMMYKGKIVTTGMTDDDKVFSIYDSNDNKILSFGKETSIFSSGDSLFAFIIDSGDNPYSTDDDHYLIVNATDSKTVLHSSLQLSNIVYNQSYFTWERSLKDDTTLYSTDRDMFILFDNLYGEDRYGAHCDFHLSAENPEQGIFTFMTGFDMESGYAFAYYYFKPKQ